MIGYLRWMRTIFRIVLYYTLSILDPHFLMAQVGNALYLDRQPSARYEAMGKTAVASEGELYGVWANPAIAASISGSVVSYSIDPNSFYLADDENWSATNFGLGFRNSRFGVTYFQTKKEIIDREFILQRIDAGYQLSSQLALGVGVQKIGATIYYSNAQTISAHEPLPANLNFYEGYYLDFGAMGTQDFTFGKISRMSLIWGISANNIIRYDRIEVGEVLVPKIARAGLALKIPTVNNVLTEARTITELLYASGDSYEQTVRSFRAGLELQLISLVYLRGGWYSEEDLVNGSAWTYGIAIGLPRIRRLGAYPIHFEIGVNKMKQPSYAENFDDWDDFYNFDFIISWSPID